MTHRWPHEWSEHLGETVTVEGTALNAVLGALLAGKGPAVWIDGMASWPEGYYLGGDRGKRVRVTGRVIVRADLPVFIEHPDEEVRHGMPVRLETDLREAGERFLLESATWTPLD